MDPNFKDAKTFGDVVPLLSFTVFDDVVAEVTNISLGKINSINGVICCNTKLDKMLQLNFLLPQTSV